MPFIVPQIRLEIQNMFKVVVPMVRLELTFSIPKITVNRLEDDADYIGICKFIFL